MEVHNLLHYARELLQASTTYHVDNLDITKNKYSDGEMEYLHNRTRFNHRAQAELNRLVTSIIDQAIVEYERIINTVAEGNSKGKAKVGTVSTLPGLPPDEVKSNLVVDKPTQLQNPFLSSLEGY